MDSAQYHFKPMGSINELHAIIQAAESPPDCLLIWEPYPEVLLHQLKELYLLLPTVVVHSHGERGAAPYPVVWIGRDQLHQLPQKIEQAIANFLQLPNANITEPLQKQQQRLANKLRERLGYLGVYYKRDPKRFFRYLSPEEREATRQSLKQTYEIIVLEYFKEQSECLNATIDEFVNMSFWADISVSQVLEIHMELMDEFAHRLHIEGRSDEVLLDYRITLIDIIAHLCEMYRRSIPREE